MLYIMPVALLLAASGLATNVAREFNPTDAYEYIDCADQRTGAPLLECSELKISAAEEQLKINDLVENFGVVKDQQYWVLGSAYAPISVPKNSHATRKTWTISGVTYRQADKKVSNVLSGNNDVYVFSANRDGKTILTFWFSPRLGVRAIGFPQKGVDSGKVYYCASTKCLFEDTK